MTLRDWFLTAAERENPATSIDAIHPGDQAWSTGNSVRTIVHGRHYFAELYDRISAMGPGDRLYFVDWRGDPDEQLTDDPASTVSAVFAAAARRGVEVRGLLWRSHWRHFGFHSDKALYLGEEIGKAGGQCLRDMRVRTGGAHHQKFVVLRHTDATKDVAYVGGIDLCHSRRDDERHLGDAQPLLIAPDYGPTPPWHDVQVAIQGPAVYDVETTFRERWEDSTPLTLNPGRSLSSFLQGEDLDPDPLSAQAPPPPPVPAGHCAVQVLRTYPSILPKGYDFAPDGERSIALGNTKAIAQARRLVYIEDQYLWSTQVGEHFAAVLKANPDLRLAIVLPQVPDLDGAVAKTTQLYARALALEPILAAGGDRVAVFSLVNEQGLPIYVHAKVCVIDDRWASVGSDNLNRRSWTSDTEIACAVMDERVEEAGAAVSDDAFAVTLLRELVAEHLGCRPDEVPRDPHELFDAMVASADALDAWLAGEETDPVHGLRARATRVAGAVGDRRRHRKSSRSKARDKVARRADALLTGRLASGERPPGRLLPLAAPELSRAQKLYAAPLYDVVFDPDGTILRDEDLTDLTTPDLDQPSMPGGGHSAPAPGDRSGS